MRYVCSAAAAVIAFVISAPSIALAQSGSPELSITSYQFVNEQRVTRTQWYITYRADILNRSTSPLAVTATVTSLTPAVEVVTGQGTLHFLTVAPNGQVTSVDTFTLLVDRSVPFVFTNLKWSFQNPVANAGPNQTATIGNTVTLNGSGSSNPSGAGSLTYNWTLKVRPAPSIAALSGPNGVMTSFVVDAAGAYVVALTVSNGVATDIASVTISTVNSPPVANPGPNQTVGLNSVVTLNGSASSDVDGDTLSYLWNLVTRAAGSSAELSNARTPVATFVADKPGTYVAQLVVNDGKVDSAPATVRVTTTNTQPVGNAGGNQTVSVGGLVQLNGSGSTDVDGDQLTFKWSFNAIPNGSVASLSSINAVNPTFTADLPGTYVAQLIVNDGQVDSTPSTVMVTTTAVQAPVADAGPNQTVVHGATVTLSASGTDLQGLPLTLTWSLSTRPPDSTAALSSTNGAHPTFIADKPGIYVAQLMVGNGYFLSAPATVTITTTNTAPVAVAGVNQNVAVGVTVFLDGSGSSDPDHDPFTYSWSFTSLPSSSMTSIQGAATRTPSFFADMPGTYVVQLIVNDGFTNSSPATVTITASLMKVTLTPNQLSLLNVPQILTITLSAPAGTGGIPVTLTGFDPSIISVPPSVTVPENSTGANVMVTPVSAGSTNILASAPGYQPGAASVTVTTPTITVALSFTAVGMTRSINGTITLGAPAPVGDVVIVLSSNPVGGVTFDSVNVRIPAGSTTGTFRAIGVTEGTATITGATVGYISGSASILVVNLGGILLPTDLTVPPGQTAMLDVRLSTVAPVGGVTVTLVSGDSSVLGVSPTVFIAHGATTAATPAQVNGIKFGSTTVTASAGGYTGDSRTVKVAGTLSFSPQAVTVGAAEEQSISLILSAPAPASGLSIILESSNTAVATVPPSVVINSNTTSASVLLRGVALGSTTITASTTTPNVTAGSLLVTVAVSGSIILPLNVTVGQGQSAAFPITLSAPAPASGTTVVLFTSNSTTVDIQPKSVTILAGQTQPATQPQVVGNGLGPATITASAAGYGSTSQTVQGNTTLSFAPPNLTITGVETKDFTLTLAAPAPSGGLTVNLTVSPAGVVTVPASVLIAQNTTTATVHVTGVAAGMATVTAATNSPQIANATATVTVQNGGTIGLPANVTVGPSQSLPFAVILSSPAPPAGVTVALSTNDSAKVSIAPASVFIDAGHVQPSAQPQVTGGEFGSAVISASAPGYAPASQGVKVGAALSWPAPDITITGPDTKNITLTLSAPAPSAVSVSLSASPAGVITIPQAVTIAQNATTATVTLKGTSVGATTITASSAMPNVSNATCNITVQSAGAIGLPSNVTIGLGQTAAFQVTLPATAPQGGVTVTLSSDTPKVSITPASVTIDAGQTQPAVAPQVMGKDLGTANLTASAPVYTSTTKPVQVTATIGLSPLGLTLSGTETQNLTLTLSAPAPSSGLTFNVSSSNTSVATVGSPTVTMQPGAIAVTIPVSGVATGSAVIHVSAPNLTEATANVTVNTLADIMVPASVSVSPGESVPFPISLTKAAQSLLFLELTSSDPAKATVSPASITIPTGQIESTNKVRVYGSSTGTTTITVKAVNGSLAQATSAVTVSYRLMIAPASLTITGNGNHGFLTLTLSAPAPAGGVDLTLTSSNPSVVTVLSGVSISANSTSITVRLTSVAEGTALIHASGPNIPEATASVTVVPPGSVSISGPASMGLSTTGTITVALSSPATGNGVNVDLTSSDATRVSVSPTTVTIPAGATTPLSQPQLVAVNVGSASISASAQGYTPPTPLVVQVNASVSWPSQHTTIIGVGNQALLQLRLSSMAPLAGLTVNLSSSNPAVATIQPSAMIIWDGSTAPIILIQVTAAGLGSTTIHASGTNIPDATTTVTVSGPLGITTASLPNGNVGAPYNGVVAATGGTTPYTWTATGLPTGLSIVPGTGAITGTPSAAGAATVNVTVTDASSPTPSSVSKQFLMTIGATLTLTTASLPNGAVGATYNSGPLSAVGGTPSYSWGASGLPAGLSIDPVTGAITGTPSAAGAATITVTVTDATLPTHASVSKQFPVTITTTLAITTTSLPNGVVGATYNSGPLSAAGGTTPYSWGASGLPAGLSIAPATGAISGTANAAGAATITVTVTDAALPTHASVSKQFAVTIGATLTITTAALPDGVVGAAYNSGPLSAAGGTTPYSWGASGLPAGLSIAPATGAITGTPSAAGAATITVTVTDATLPTHASVSKQFSATIGATLTITTAALPDGVATSVYSAPVAGSGGNLPYTWAATGLPAGLSIDPATGAIAGTTIVTGTATVNITVTDATIPTHVSVSKQFSLIIMPTLTITTLSLADGVVGSVYNGPVSASGGTPSYAWAATGLPANLSIDPATGAIKGTPTAAGATTVHVTVTDTTSPAHQSASKDLSLTIRPALAITTASLHNGVVGSAYTDAVAASGGTLPYLWSQTGLPAGLTVDAASGAITGNPTAAGSAAVNVTVTDAALPTHQSVLHAFSITIAPHVTITTPSLPNGTAGTAYNGPLAATGGTPPYVWSATGLPAGLTVDPATGAVTGTPSAAGSFTVNVLATDATIPVHQSVSQQYSVTIASGTLTITTTSLPGGQIGAAYTFPVVAAGGTAPLHWSATGLQTGLTINASTGQITGTPTSGGTSSVNFLVTDTGSPVQTATKTLSIIIQILKITTPSPLPSGTAGASYTYQLAATGGVLPLAWSALALPRGMTLNSVTGVLSGVPSFPSSNTLSISVSDSSNPLQHDSKDLSVTILAVPLQITTTFLPDGLLGAAYTSWTLTAIGGTQPYSWSATGLPLGLLLSSSGTISGTPTGAGSSSVTIMLTDGASPTPQQASKTLSLTVSLVTAGLITVTNAAVGENLQVPITITFTPPLPSAATVTITSGNPALIKLGSGGVAGIGSVQAPLSAGTGSVSVFVKATGSSGQVNITASVPGYPNGTGTVTLASSGFVIAGANGTGGAISTYLGVSSTLTVYAARLDNSGLFVESQQIRGEYAVNVPVSSSLTNIGNVSSPAVVFSGGMNSTTLQFVASQVTTGVTNVIVGPVPLFTEPAAGSSLVVTVNGSGLIPFTATIGKNLQKTVSISRTGSGATNATVTVHSQDAAKLKFSTAPTGPTSDTITVTIAQFQTFSGDFYAHVFESTGTAAYTLSAANYGSVDSTVVLVPSGLVIWSPFGAGVNFTMSLGPVNATLSVYTARLDPVSGSPVEYQAVASGASISTSVAVDNTAVGNITISPVTISSGSPSASTEFHAAGAGGANITASAAGYGSGSVAVTVQSPTLVVSDGLVIGKFLQETGTLILPVRAPTGGLHVTLQSNSALLKLATTDTAPGSATIGLDIAEGGFIATYYIQSLGSFGTATYTATAPGYNPATGNVDLIPSGIVISGPPSVGLAGGAQPVTVYTAQLDAANAPINPQPLAGGQQLVVSLTNSNRGAGTVPSSVTVLPGTFSSIALFTPSAVGSTTVAVVQPAGWTLPTIMTSVGITVQ